MRVLDRWLDEYETRWQSSPIPPNLDEFLTNLGTGVPSEWRAALLQELALIDLEQRWRRFYRPASPADAKHPNERFPLTPTWRDYCERLNLVEDSLEAICHEFRVRQAFGDRPDYESFMSSHLSQAEKLARELPPIAAKQSRAKISVCHAGRAIFSCALQGQMEIGRRRQGEPDPPALLSHGTGHRLIIADLAATQLSRRQCSLEAIARGRLRVRHHNAKGWTLVNFNTQVAAEQSCVVSLPVSISFRDWSLTVGS